MTRAAAVAALALLLVSGVAHAETASEVRLAPSPNGVLGAWLVAGPFKGTSIEATPAGVDENKLAPAKGGAVGGTRDLGRGKVRPPARWQVVSTGGGTQDPGTTGSRTIDLRAGLEDATGSDLVAYAAGRLHVERPGRHYLLLGVDDGVRVAVDGKIVLARDEARAVRDDDDVIALDLAAGDHDVVLKLHQRDDAWAFRAKLVDASFAPSPGAYLDLPGTDASDAAKLAEKMSWVVLDRGFDARTARYRPVLTVRYPDGAPLGVELPVAARLLGAPDALAFDVRPGNAGVGDLVVALPPIDPLPSAATLETTVAGRVIKSTLAARPRSEQALVRAERALAKVRGDEPWLVAGSLDSVRHLVKRLGRFLARGDGDAEAQADEARELDELAANLERGVDPYDGRSGPMRRALVTPLDGAPSELGLYVPSSYARSNGRRYPLVVGLHGMRSAPLSFMRALFGLDDPKKEAAWKDRHFRDVGPYPAVDAFVITPYAHGDTMYREIGEDDVLAMIDWAKRTFPIDDTRITVTGVSMGGIGSASIPFHFPHVFAAAEPLCGYHSYLIRADIAPRAKRPWEKSLLEERSNVLWAENGEHLPLWIVHGTRDLPEANSGVLIDRYEQLQYSIKHDHPDAGHDVWGITYGELKGMKWLLSHRLDLHPAHVRFRTMRTRYGKSAWVTVDELASEMSWGDVDARIKNKSTIAVTTSGVSALTLARDEKLVDPITPTRVTVDRTTLGFGPDEAIVMHRSGDGSWTKGAPAHERRSKQGHVTGPLRDVFHEPVLFVYAADEEARVNERVARGLADHPGVSTSYPVMSDAEFLAHGEALANDRALFLVGRGNRVFAALDAAASKAGTPFPMHVVKGGVKLGAETFAGAELGGAFIHPNPVRPDRYVVFYGGADAAGMLRALSLPDLLPDFVVWDRDVARARGKLLLGSASFRAGGSFQSDWSLPAKTADPLATGTPSKVERDDTPPFP